MLLSNMSIQSFPRSAKWVSRSTGWSIAKSMALLATAMLAFAGPSCADEISPRRLLEVVDFGAPVVSPNGTRVAFRVEQASIERNTYDSVWYVQDMTGATLPRRVADGGVPIRDSAGGSLPMPAVWSPDGQWIYYRALLDGRIDVWRAAIDGSGAVPLTLDPADVREFSLSADGKTLRYSVGATRQEVMQAEQDEYDRGIRIDGTVPIGQPLYRSGNLEGRLATQRFSGAWFDRASLLAGAAEHWKAVDLAPGERRELLSGDAPPRLPVPSDFAEHVPGTTKLAFEPGKGRIALLMQSEVAGSSTDRSKVQLAMLPDAQARKPIQCLAAPCMRRTITSVLWRIGTDDVLFTTTDREDALAQSIYRWNVRSGKVSLVVQSRGLINGGRDRFSTCGLSAAAMACVVAEADLPPRLEWINLQSGQRKLLFDPNAALARDIALTVPAQLIRWNDAAGRSFTGQFFAARPSGKGAPPLFITYYSCTGFLRGGVGDEWPLASLAERGISALCINQGPSRNDAVERYDQGLSAVQSVIATLASQGRIDPTRVGMGGLSFGSEVTLWTATRSDLLSAASVTSPMATPNYFLFSSLKGDGFFAQLKKAWGLGAPADTAARWSVISPASNLDRINTPILMQMPEQEYLYALEYAIPLMRRNLVDLYAFPNEPHQKFLPRHKLAAYERNLDWFSFWLMGTEDPARGKEAQYLHWRSMRSHGTAAGRKPG